jgi:hypothetical protein
MPMPKAAMNKYDRPVFCEDEIRRTGEGLRVQSKSEASPVEKFPNLQLRRRVFRPDCRHIPRTRRRVMNVPQSSRSQSYLSSGSHQTIDVRLHDPEHLLEHRDRNGVSKLLVGLCVRNRDHEIIVVAHEAGAFAGG